MSQKRKIQKQEPEKKGLSKNVKITISAVVGVVVLALIGVALWLQFRPDKIEPEIPKRYENIEHISADIYQVILGDMFFDELDEDDLEIWKEIEKNLERDVYVFIYNADYEESTDSKDLENLVNEAYNKEDKNYTFLVLNYLEHENITSLIISSHGLPIRPVLVHIEGEVVAEDGYGTTFRDIQSMLIGLRGSGE